MYIAQCSDAHLGYQRFNRARSETRKMDFFKCFQEAINEIITRGCDVAVFPGDLFDNPDPDNETIAFTIRHLKMLMDEGIEVIVTSGQHDTPKSNRSHIFSVLSEAGFDKIVYEETQIFDIKGTKFVVVPWQYKTPVDWSSIPSGDVLVIHLPTKEWYIDPGERVFDPEEFDNRWNLILLGDYHSRTEPTYNAFYSGGLERTSFGEEKSACGLLFHDFEEDTLEFWDSPARGMITVEVDAEDLGASLDALDNFSDYVVRLKISGDASNLNLLEIDRRLPLCKKVFVSNTENQTEKSFQVSSLSETWDNYCNEFNVDDDVSELGKEYFNSV